VQKRLALLVVALVVVSQFCHPQRLSDLNSAVRDKPVFRAPFLLKLRIDGQHYYEERFKAGGPVMK
jgi:hypothetical protein